MENVEYTTALNNMDTKGEPRFIGIVPACAIVLVCQKHSTGKETHWEGITEHARLFYSGHGYSYGNNHAKNKIANNAE